MRWNSSMRWIKRNDSSIKTIGVIAIVCCIIVLSSPKNWDVEVNNEDAIVKINSVHINGGLLTSTAEPSIVLKEIHTDMIIDNYDLLNEYKISLEFNNTIKEVMLYYIN